MMKSQKMNLRVEKADTRGSQHVWWVSWEGVVVGVVTWDGADECFEATYLTPDRRHAITVPVLFDNYYMAVGAIISRVNQ